MADTSNNAWTQVLSLSTRLSQHVQGLQASLEHQAQQALQATKCNVEQFVSGVVQQHRKRARMSHQSIRLPFASVSASRGTGSSSKDEVDNTQHTDDVSAGAGTGGEKGTQDSERKLTPQQREELEREIAALTDEEREQLYAWAQQGLLENIKIKHDGKKLDLWELIDEAKQDQALHDANLDEYKKRGIPPSLRKDEVSSLDLRQGQEKAMLFPEEQASLGLRRMAMGAIWSPFPWKWLGRQLLMADIAYGIFAWPEKVGEHMSEWAGQDPKAVIQEPLFYQHALACAPDIQTTLMLVPVKDIPVKRTQDMLLGELRKRLAAMEGGITDDDERTLKRMQHLFSAWTLEPTGLITKKGCYARGSSFFLSTLPDGNLAAEAITPGPIRDQKAVPIAVFDNPKVTYAVMDMVLGENPLDPNAKLTAGNNLVFAANKLSFEYLRTPNNWHTVDPENPYPEFESEDIDPAATQWQMDAKAKRNVFKPLRTRKVTDTSVQTK